MKIGELIGDLAVRMAWPTFAFVVFIVYRKRIDELIKMLLDRVRSGEHVRIGAFEMNSIKATKIAAGLPQDTDDRRGFDAGLRKHRNPADEFDRLLHDLRRRAGIPSSPASVNIEVQYLTADSFGIDVVGWRTLVGIEALLQLQTQMSGRSASAAKELLIEEDVLNAIDEFRRNYLPDGSQDTPCLSV